MAHQYVGFNVSGRGTVDKCVTQAATALALGHKQLIELQGNPKGEGAEAYKRWFGVMDKTRLARVTSVVTLMDIVLNSGRVKFTFNQGCGATTNAVAYQPAFGWKEAELKQTLQAGNFNISLCPRFFGQLPQDAQDRQSRTGTFVHELSHIVGNTDDEVAYGTTCYGLQMSRILADKLPDKAVNNAENYGFYATWLLQSLNAEPEEDLGGAFASLFA